LGLATCTSDCVMVEFFEGDPAPDCPLKGVRAGICFETATAFGQILNKKCLRIQPVNAEVAERFCEEYGFVLETSRKDPPYYKREI
jgi:hypothetical protein